LPLRDGSVGGVLAAFVLQNIPQWTWAVAEIARVVHPYGTVLVAWGQPVIDPLTAAVREQFFPALHETGATVGVAAAATGLDSIDLDSIDAGHAAFAEHGLAARSEHRVPGTQTRTVRQLVASWAGNPFISGASPEQRGEAAQRTLSWATARLGDVDVPHALRVELRLHGYRRG
jgi:hypothetical protein